MRVNNGFSLVELAVVIVVIGLLVAGATLGSGLMRQAELRAVLAESEKYSIAVEHFAQLYGKLPGDLPNATGSNNFFDGNTTNGDGNGQIDSATPSGTEETFAAWDQLVLARYITGSYTGAADSSSATIGTNVPASSNIAGAGFSLAWIAQPGEGAQDALGRYYAGNYLILASDDDAGTVLTGGAIPPDDAFFIDDKADNAKANSGRILGGGASCFTGADYEFSSAGNICHLYFNIKN